MARDLDPALAAAFAAAVVRPFFLYEGAFAETIRFWSGYGDLQALGQNWFGAGNLLTLSEVKEESELVASGLTFELSGIAIENISLVLNEDYQGRAARLYLGAFDPETHAIIADPFLLFEARMDQMTIDESGETTTIALTVENKLIALERPSKAHWSPEEQKARHPDDTGFDGVTALQEAQIVWKG